MSKILTPRNFGLAPVRLEHWFNLIFVNLDPKARPLRECLGRVYLLKPRKVRLQRHASFRAPHLRDELQLEDLHR
jgi:phenylpropionate dioxygenase-like ring-hydroxylating dioxygenase large terminal subunit